MSLFFEKYTLARGAVTQTTEIAITAVAKYGCLLCRSVRYVILKISETPTEILDRMSIFPPKKKFFFKNKR